MRLRTSQRRRGKHLAAAPPTSLIRNLHRPLAHTVRVSRPPAHARRGDNRTRLGSSRSVLAHARHGSTATRGRVRGAVVVGVLAVGAALPAMVGGITAAFGGPANHQTHNQAVDRLLRNVALDVAAYEKNTAALQAQPPPPPTTTTTTTTTTVPPTTTTTAPPPPVTDATSVDTPDWACIRRTESGNGSASSNLYGFLGPAWHEYGDPNYSSAGAAPPDVQGQAALRLYRANGYKFSGAWNDPCTQSGGGSLH